jgi:hypothetical protein
VTQQSNNQTLTQHSFISNSTKHCKQHAIVGTTNNDVEIAKPLDSVVQKAQTYQCCQGSNTATHSRMDEQHSLSSVAQSSS